VLNTIFLQKNIDILHYAEFQKIIFMAEDFINNFWVKSCVIGLIAIGALTTILTNHKEFPKDPVSFATFDSSEISGHLGHIATIGHSNYFSLQEEPGKFYNVGIFPIDYRRDKSFREQAKIGDSIVKHKYEYGLELFASDGVVHNYQITKEPKGYEKE